MPRLQTPRLDLIPGTVTYLRAELEGPEALAAALGVDVPASWPPQFYDAEAVRYTLDSLLTHPNATDWGFYYLVRRQEARPSAQGAHIARPTLVGAGGFRGAPNDQGMVEVGYSVVVEHQRRGYATEVVEGWLRFAFDDPRVAMVIAHTLPSLAPSIGVLERAGFRFAGAGHDPHAPAGAEVLRYELSRTEYAARAAAQPGPAAT